MHDRKNEWPESLTIQSVPIELYLLSPTRCPIQDLIVKSVWDGCFLWFVTKSVPTCNRAIECSTFLTYLAIKFFFRVTFWDYCFMENTEEHTELEIYLGDRIDKKVNSKLSDFWPFRSLHTGKLGCEKRRTWCRTAISFVFSFCAFCRRPNNAMLRQSIQRLTTPVVCKRHYEESPGRICYFQ